MTDRPVKWLLHYWLNDDDRWQLAARPRRGYVINLGHHTTIDAMRMAARRFIATQGMSFGSPEWQWENSRVNLEPAP